MSILSLDSASRPACDKLPHLILRAADKPVRMGHERYSRHEFNFPARPCALQVRDNDPNPGIAFIGRSPAIERLRTQARRVAPHLRIALITGERGTGKEQIARALHSLSGKDTEAFRQLQSAVELHRVRPDHVGSRRPTCYLPNLSALAPLDQAELLSAIHRLEALQPSDRRPQLIFATAIDLRGLVAAGQFHPELYAKISSVEITAPPLRTRPEDIPDIVATLLNRQPAQHPHARSASYPELLDNRALSRLKGYSWPGNLRELGQVLALARLHARSRPGEGFTIEAMHLPLLEAAPGRTAMHSSNAAAASGRERDTERLDEVIERHVLGVLLRCSGNKVRAAERLGISRSTLYRMLEANPSAASIAQTH